MVNKDFISNDDFKEKLQYILNVIIIIERNRYDFQKNDNIISKKNISSLQKDIPRSGNILDKIPNEKFLLNEKTITNEPEKISDKFIYQCMIQILKKYQLTEKDLNNIPQTYITILRYIIIIMDEFNIEITINNSIFLFHFIYCFFFKEDFMDVKYFPIEDKYFDIFITLFQFNFQTFYDIDKTQLYILKLLKLFFYFRGDKRLFYNFFYKFIIYNYRNYSNKISNQKYHKNIENIFNSIYNENNYFNTDRIKNLFRTINLRNIYLFKNEQNLNIEKGWDEDLYFYYKEKFYKEINNINQLNENSLFPIILDLKDNNIEDKDLSLIFKEIVQSDKSFKKIDLSFNNITKEGINTISKYINQIEIEILDLSNNDIDPNQTLITPSINLYNDVFFIRLIEKLNKNKKLEILNLSNNYISSSIIKLMIENMSDNIYLKQINFCYQKGILSRDILRSIFDLINEKNLKVDIYLPSYNNDIDLVIQNIQNQQENLQNQQINQTQNEQINQQTKIQNNKNTKIQTNKNTKIQTNKNTKIQNNKNTKIQTNQQTKIQNQIIIKDKTLQEVYNELKSSSKKVEIIKLDNIKNSLRHNLNITKNIQILRLIQEILQNKDIKEIYISNSNIFPKNEVRLYETNKRVLSIDNCNVKNIIISNNNINIDTLVLSKNKLRDSTKNLLGTLEKEGKIKKLIIT